MKKEIRIGSQVKVVESNRSFHEIGSIGWVVDETPTQWLVEFRDEEGEPYGSLMDYFPSELKLVAE